MAKKTKLTASSIAKAMELVDKDTAIITCGKGDAQIDIPVKTRLTINERGMMINDITNMIFIDDGYEVRYCPAFKNFAIEYNIVAYFTDIALPANTEKAFKFLEQSGIAHSIAQVLPVGYITNIIADANEAIEYRKQTILRKSKLDDVLEAVLTIIQTLNTQTEGMDLAQIMKYIEDNMPEFKGQIEQLVSAQTSDATATV